MKLSGKIQDKVFTFEESNIIAQDFDGQTMSWCIKQGTLNYSKKEGEVVLQGNWTGTAVRSTCAPGTITLKRKTNQQQQDKSNKQGRKLKEAARAGNK